MNKTSAKVINNYANSIAMKKIINKKGWSKQDAVYALADYVTSGSKVSVYEFLNNYKNTTVSLH
jgi:hypothetical protein